MKNNTALRSYRFVGDAQVHESIFEDIRAKDAVHKLHVLLLRQQSVFFRKQTEAIAFFGQRNANDIEGRMELVIAAVLKQ